MSLLPIHQLAAAQILAFDLDGSDATHDPASFPARPHAVPQTGRKRSLTPHDAVRFDDMHWDGPSNLAERRVSLSPRSRLVEHLSRQQTCSNSAGPASDVALGQQDSHHARGTSAPKSMDSAADLPSLMLNSSHKFDEHWHPDDAVQIWDWVFEGLSWKDILPLLPARLTKSNASGVDYTLVAWDAAYKARVILNQRRESRSI